VVAGDDDLVAVWKRARPVGELDGFLHGFPTAEISRVDEHVAVGDVVIHRGVQSMGVAQRDDDGAFFGNGSENLSVIRSTVLNRSVTQNTRQPPH
jgi:hypothetical protein